MSLNCGKFLRGILFPVMVCKMTIDDEPSSQGVANTLKRAKQLVEIKWTPVRDFPKLASKTEQGLYPANEVVTGIPYSSVRAYDKYIPYNVSLKTFMSALENPHSVVYTENLFGQYERAVSYYGIVCAVFVSYALNLPFRVPCKVWHEIEGMRPVNSNRLEDYRLCDVLRTEAHVALITGITRTPEGTVSTISISEATIPKCICKTYTPDEYRESRFYKENFTVFRYDRLDEIPYEASPFVQLEGEKPLPLPPPSALGINYGSGANYRKGEKIIFSVLEPGFKSLEVFCEGELVEAIELTGRPENVERQYTKSGNYYAVCRDEQRDKKAETLFCIVDVVVTADKTIYVPGEKVSLSFSCKDLPVCYFLCDAKTKFAFALTILSEAESRQKRAEFICPPTVIKSQDKVVAEGEYAVKVYCRNENGDYASDYFYFQSSGEN